MFAAIAGRPRPYLICTTADLGCLCSSAIPILVGIRVAFIIVAVRLSSALPASHTNVTPDADSTPLLRNGLAQVGALRQTRKLFCAVDAERLRLNSHTPVKAGVPVFGIVAAEVTVLRVLYILVQMEGEDVAALVADREIGKQEVASFRWSVQVCHSGDGHAGQDGWLCSRSLNTTVSHGAGGSKLSIQEEVRVVSHGDIFHVLAAGGTLGDLELNNRWRVNWTTIRGSFATMLAANSIESSRVGIPRLTLLARTACTGTLGLLQNGQVIEELMAGSRRAVKQCRCFGDFFDVGRRQDSVESCHFGGVVRLMCRMAPNGRLAQLVFDSDVGWERVSVPARRIKSRCRQGHGGSDSWEIQQAGCTDRMDRRSLDVTSSGRQLTMVPEVQNGAAGSFTSCTVRSISGRLCMNERRRGDQGDDRG